MSAPSGNQLRLADLIDGDALGADTTVSVTGNTGSDVVLTAQVQATAAIPDSDAPFSLGTAGFTATWGDITQPTNVNVVFTGGISDFLKVQVDQILGVLQQLQAAAVDRNEPLPAGFDKIVSLLQAINDGVTAAAGDGGTSTGSAGFTTVQGLASRIALGLNTDLEKLGLSLTAAC